MHGGQPLAADPTPPCPPGDLRPLKAIIRALRCYFQRFLCTSLSWALLWPKRRFKFLQVPSRNHLESGSECPARPASATNALPGAQPSGPAALTARTTFQAPSKLRPRARVHGKIGPRPWPPGRQGLASEPDHPEGASAKSQEQGLQPAPTSPQHPPNIGPLGSGPAHPNVSCAVQATHILSSFEYQLRSHP